MKKKICMLIAIVCCFSFSSAAAFASSEMPEPVLEQIEIENPGGTVAPCYDTVSTTLISYDIDGSTAGVYTKLTTKNVGITSATVKIQLIKSGTIVQTYSGTMTKTGTYLYTKTKNFSLSSKGSYAVKVTFKTYKNGTLQETITKTTGYKTYS